MDDDRIDARLLEQRDVAGERLAQADVAHRMAAILHHHGLVLVALHVGQRRAKAARACASAVSAMSVVIGAASLGWWGVGGLFSGAGAFEQGDTCRLAGRRLRGLQIEGNAIGWTAMTPEDISKLIVRVSTRDRAAFDQLYRQVSAKLFGVCLRVLNDRAEAEEALQEVFVKVWTKADRFAVSELSPISWLVAVARNHAIDRIRARRLSTVDVDTALQVADPAPGPEAIAVAAGESDRIGRLPRRTGAGPCRGGSGRLPERRELRRAGGAPRRAAEHDAHLAATQPDETEGMPGAMSLAEHGGPDDGGDRSARRRIRPWRAPRGRARAGRPPHRGGSGFRAPGRPLGGPSGAARRGLRSRRSARRGQGGARQAPVRRRAGGQPRGARPVVEPRLLARPRRGVARRAGRRHRAAALAARAARRPSAWSPRSPPTRATSATWRWSIPPTTASRSLTCPANGRPAAISSCG